MFPLSNLMKSFVQQGRLNIYDADGKKHVYEGSEGPMVTMRLHDKKLYRDLVFKPELAAGEAYMDETLTFEEGSTVKDFLYFFKLNGKSLANHPLQKVLGGVNWLLRPLQQANKKPKALKNVAHHYDLGNDFYKLFLDKNMLYSCAYFRSPDDTLEEAQRNKLRLIAAKLCLKPGMKVLDIGCGWGDMAMYLAAMFDVEVVGVTLSTEQQQLATKRAEEAGFGQKVSFRLTDYRDLEEKFDRIVSIGMFEHVGVYHYDEFFKQLNRLMPDDGVALIHSIAHMSPPGNTSPWFRKYIFPGGYSPSVSEVLPVLETNNLWVMDMETLRVHYADTLDHWYRRFEANREEIEAMYDKRFARMWEFYLLSAEMVFRTGPNFVFHLQLSRQRDATPTNRDYTVHAQEELIKREKKLGLNL